MANGKIHGLSSAQSKHICQIAVEGMSEQMLTVRATVEVSNVKATFDARYAYIHIHIYIYII